MFNFSSSLIEDQIVVFGGMGGDYMQSKNLYQINLEDERSVYNFQQDDFAGIDGEDGSVAKRDESEGESDRDYYNQPDSGF